MNIFLIYIVIALLLALCFLSAKELVEARGIKSPATVQNIIVFSAWWPLTVPALIWELITNPEV